MSWWKTYTGPAEKYNNSKNYTKDSPLDNDNGETLSDKFPKYKTIINNTILSYPPSFSIEKIYDNNGDNKHTDFYGDYTITGIENDYPYWKHVTANRYLKYSSTRWEFLAGENIKFYSINTTNIYPTSSSVTWHRSNGSRRFVTFTNIIKTKYENEISAVSTDPEKILCTQRNNIYYDNKEQLLKNKVDLLIHAEKKAYRDKVAAAWVTGTQNVIVNDGFEINLHGTKVPKTKTVVATYRYNTVSGESYYL